MSDKDYDCIKLSNQLCFPLYACSREIVKKYHRPLKELGLTYPQYITMMVLWEEKEISVRDMGKRLYLDSGTLTPLLKNLEAKGLISRRRSSEDERVIITTVTEKGIKLREKALNIPEKLASCVSITPEEAAELYRILYKILENC